MELGSVSFEMDEGKGMVLARASTSNFILPQKKAGEILQVGNRAMRRTNCTIINIVRAGRPKFYRPVSK